VTLKHETTIVSNCNGAMKLSANLQAANTYNLRLKMEMPFPHSTSCTLSYSRCAYTARIICVKLSKRNEYQ